MREAADARRRPARSPSNGDDSPASRVSVCGTSTSVLSRGISPRVSRTPPGVRSSVRADPLCRRQGSALRVIVARHVRRSRLRTCRRVARGRRRGHRSRAPTRHPGAVPTPRADRAVWLPWMLRVTWIAAAAVGWPAVTSAVSDRSDAVEAVATVGAIVAWVVGVVAMAIPATVVVDGDARDRAVGTGCRPRHPRRRRRHGRRSRVGDRRRAGDARRDVGRVRQVVRAGIGVRRRGTASAASPARVRRCRRPRLDRVGRRADRRSAVARGAGLDPRRDRHRRRPRRYGDPAQPLAPAVTTMARAGAGRSRAPRSGRARRDADAPTVGGRRGSVSHPSTPTPPISPAPRPDTPSRSARRPR